MKTPAPARLKCIDGEYWIACVKCADGWYYETAITPDIYRLTNDLRLLAQDRNLKLDIVMPEQGLSDPTSEPEIYHRETSKEPSRETSDEKKT